jgi:hypothetical protein
MEPVDANRPLVLGHAIGDDSWHPVAVGGAGLDGDGDGVASRAIAPLPRGDLIYAWSGEVWRIRDAESAWTLVRRRRALGELMADVGSVWTVDDASGEVLSSGGARLAPIQAGAPGQVAAGQPGNAWLVEEDGDTSRIRGPLGRKTDAPAIPDVRAITALDAVAGTVVSAGKSDELSDRVVAGGNAIDGRLAVWENSAAGWEQIAVVGGEPLRATGIAAGPSGWTWLTAAEAGADVARPTQANRLGGPLRATQSGRAGDLSQRLCPAGFHGRVVALPPDCATGPCAPIVWCFEPSLAAVTAAGSEGAWAAGGHLLVRCQAGACRQEASSPAPFGSRFEAIAAGADDDVWAALVQGARGRARSLLVHFDGASWSETCRFDVGITDLAVASGGGDRTLWIAGDWSTLIRHSYAPGALGHACSDG